MRKRVVIVERFIIRIMFTTMFIAHLPVPVFSFSVKLSGFTSASKARIILHYFHLCAHFFQDNVNANQAHVFRLP